MLDYYRKLCELNNFKLKEVSSDFLSKHILFVRNIHLYLVTDQIKHMRIAVYSDENIEYYNIDFVANIDEYFYFMPMQEITAILSSSPSIDYVNFSILEYSNSYTLGINDLRGLLKWIDIEELTDKINKAIESLLVHFQMFHNKNLSLYKDINYSIDYVSDKNNNFERDIDYYAEYISKYGRYTAHEPSYQYYAIYIYNKYLKKQLYINFLCNKEKIKYSLNVKSKGNLIDNFFYFPILLNKSLLIYIDEFGQYIQIFCMKDNKIIFNYRMESLYEISSLLHLVNRNDINLFFEKIDYLKTNKWQEYVKAD